MAEEYDHQVLTDMKVRLPKKVRVSRSYSENQHYKSKLTLIT